MSRVRPLAGTTAATMAYVEPPGTSEAAEAAEPNRSGHRPGTEPGTAGPETDPGTAAPGTAPSTPTPDTKPDTAPETTEPGTAAPDTEPETAKPHTAPSTPTPDTKPDTAPETTEPGTAAPDTEPETAKPHTAPSTPTPDTKPDTAPETTEPGTAAPGTEPGTTSETAEPGTAAPGTEPETAVPGAKAWTAVPGTAGSDGAVPLPERIEGLLLGLAAGDAAGWPAARHRAARMPQWTRRLTRELDTFAEQNATTTLPVPIALNQPPEPLRLGPSDDAEWAAFAAEAVLRAGDDSALGDLSRDRRMRAAIDLSWNAVASEVAAASERAPEVESAVLPLRARISVRAGLGNLAAGLRPPATGHDNPHYFDDAACVRACVLAVVHPGAPRPAADLAEFDARYTQDGDGVHGARAMAAALACALDGADVHACVSAALAELPEATEIGRNARQALALAADAESTFALVPLLEHRIVDHVYSYGIAAAETVPVALALATAAGGRIAEAVPAAACLSRVADSAPALAGALTGALGGGASVPASWRDACRVLPGCVLPRLTGTDLVELAGLLHARHPSRPEARPEGRPEAPPEGRDTP